VSFGKDVWKLEQHTFNADETVKWLSKFWKKFSSSVPQKVKHRVTKWLIILSLGIYQREMRTQYVKKILQNVHSSISHYSPKVETTQMSINWWMDKQNVVHR
jgi:hypothetical protein